MKTASLLLLQRNGSGNLDKSAEGEGRTLGIVTQDSGEKCGRDRDFLPVPGVYISNEQERLLIEAAQKDPGRFADLYENNFERVYAFIVRRVRDRHEAEDLTAEVFQHALANLPRFEWRGVPFAAWLFRIAANAIADRWQRISKEDPILFPTISIGPVGKRSNAAPCCFS